MIDMSPDQIDHYFELISQVKLLSTDVQNIENCTDETKFYLDTSDILFKYYDHFDQVNMPQSSNKKPIKVTESLPSSGEIYSMKDFLNKNKKTTSSPTINTNSGSINEFSKSDSYDKFLAKTDPHYYLEPKYSNAEEFCHECQEYRELVISDAVLICPICDSEVTTIMESDKPSYKDPPSETVYFPYKRINHLKEQLSHSQAKETTKIPQDVYDMILVEMKKEKKTNLAELNKLQIRRYLHKYSHLDYNKYYDNITQIIYHLNKLPPLSLPPEVEDQLCHMFTLIQEPYARHRPANRLNFLSYSYTINKLCEILGYTEYLQYFSLLKSKDKLHTQDIIWKKICRDMNWKYYPSTRSY